MAKKKSTLSQVAKRFGITAREARDIATAVGTAATASSIKAGSRLSADVRANLKQQIKEVGTAAAKGKKGTTSARFVPAKKSKVKGAVTYKTSKTR